MDGVACWGSPACYTAHGDMISSRLYAGPAASKAGRPGSCCEHCSSKMTVQAWRSRTQALDVLTPIGRGQSLLVVGPPASGKSSTVLDAILGQRDTGVRCIFAATAHR